jgi:predicted transcriptional regulator
MKSKNLTVRLSLDLYNKIEEYANSNQLSKGSVIKKGIEEFLLSNKLTKNSSGDLMKEVDEKYSHLLNRLNILSKELTFIRNELSHGKRTY